MQRRTARRIPIGLKIFGIAASMLGLLLVVVYVSSNRLRQVNREIEALAEYIVPMTDSVAQIGVHALEQEVLFERILKHYEIEPVDRAQISREITLLEQRNREVERELRDVTALADEAIAVLAIVREREELVALNDRLGDVGQQYRDFHTHATDITALWEAGEFDRARQLEGQLAIQEAELNHSIEDILLDFEAFTVAAAKAGQSHQQIVQQLSLSIAILATGVGAAFAWVVALGLVRPVRQLTRKMQAIQAGDFSAQATISTHDEIATLASAFNHMVGELKAKAELETTFGKYVDPRVVKQLLDADPATTEGERQVMTVFFADVAGFSDFTESLPPAELVATSNRYFNLMADPIADRSGVIDKFINTMVMGFWGPPFASDTTHAELACAAAIDYLDRLPKIRALLGDRAASPNLKLPPLKLQIGLAMGPLVVGNMGSAAAKSYTVMGDTVNTASRLKGICKQYGIAIALTEETQSRLSDRFETRELDLIQVVGKDEPVRVYELVGLRSQADAARDRRRENFALGLAAYRDRDWKAASAHFAACSTGDRPDPPARLFLDRIAKFRQTPPPDDWDGVWQLTKK